MYNKSKELYKQAIKKIPGGVNSPVRAFKSVNMNPLYIDHGRGSKIYDVDGNEYIDYVGSWGPLIHGHCEPDIQNAIMEALKKGTSFGACTEKEIKFASLISDMYPSIEKIRFVNSGTEATMSAIRLARGYTGKNKIIKFDGCYHGHGDSFLIKAGSGVITFGIPGSPGVTPETAGNTLVAQYNNIDSVKNLITENKGQIAALILEPIMANAGLILPINNFLENLRNLTEEAGILLIFDEVITGFRIAPGGAQEYYGISPDLTTLGKIIGGGLPVGAFGGKKEIMDYLAPEGPVYQAGTLSGNPLAMAAGLKAVTMLKNGLAYKKLDQLGAMLENGLKSNLEKLSIPYSFNRVGSLMGLAFTKQKVVDLKTAMSSDAVFYSKYFKEMLKMGIYLAPSAYEAGFISTAHNEEDIEKTIRASYQSLKSAI
ncbi:MAG: glutamate-1-semialdehyde 2,1-aminomutase [Spirochaetales bacterium]|nr:glutamate-1-semialdehyde 2,1-aminomutase [Spirochaetales bacterium]